MAPCQVRCGSQPNNIAPEGDLQSARQRTHGCCLRRFAVTAGTGPKVKAVQFGGQQRPKPDLSTKGKSQQPPREGRPTQQAPTATHYSSPLCDPFEP
eukprot:6478668-Amphidinium_carterae.2